jgi:hypothetical protein
MRIAEEDFLDRAGQLGLLLDGPGPAVMRCGGCDQRRRDEAERHRPA